LFLYYFKIIFNINFDFSYNILQSISNNHELSLSHAIKMDIGISDCSRKSKNFKYPSLKTAIPGHGCPGKAWLSQDGESMPIASLSHKLI